MQTLHRSMAIIGALLILALSASCSEAPELTESAAWDTQEAPLSISWQGRCVQLPDGVAFEVDYGAGVARDVCAFKVPIDGAGSGGSAGLPIDGAGSGGGSIHIPIDGAGSGGSCSILPETPHLYRIPGSSVGVCSDRATLSERDIERVVTAVQVQASHLMTCPSGNGNYCGNENGADSADLYMCSNGIYSLEQQCDGGCVRTPGGQNDYCATPLASCPSGNGNYCGDASGNDTSNLYTCINGTYTLTQQCVNGCASGLSHHNGYCRMSPFAQNCAEECRRDTPAYRDPTSSEVSNQNGQVIRLTTIDTTDCNRLRFRVDKPDGTDFHAGQFFLRVGSCEAHAVVRETIILTQPTASFTVETDYRGSVGDDKIFCLTKREPSAPDDVEDAWFYSNIAQFEKVEVCQ